MKSSDLHIPRWVATVVVLVALIGGGVLALGMRNWSGHEVFGASNLALTMARKCNARIAREISATDLRPC